MPPGTFGPFLINRLVTFRQGGACLRRRLCGGQSGEGKQERGEVRSHSVGLADNMGADLWGEKVTIGGGVPGGFDVPPAFGPCGLVTGCDTRRRVKVTGEKG